MATRLGVGEVVMNWVRTMNGTQALLSTLTSDRPILHRLVISVLALSIWSTGPIVLTSVANPIVSEQAPEQLSNVEIGELVDGLEHPWGMDWLPDGSLLVTERVGRLQRIELDTASKMNVPGVPQVLADGQGGLLDVAVHPDFESNGWVYFTYSAGTLNANHTRVARARFDGASLTDWTDILSVSQLKPDTQHFGSRLLWLPDGTLLVSIGDGGNPPVSLDGRLIRLQAQNVESQLGKVLRINDDGSIPSNNPFTSVTGEPVTTWSFGHRNIQGLALDSVTGQIWATEHGARGGDELNAVFPSQNYGWPEVSHSREYFNNQPVAPVQARDDAQSPVLVWTPAIAPSGLVIYRGETVPDWQGDLFAGGLVSKDIRHIQIAVDGTVEQERSISVGARVRDIGTGPDGYLYVLTDEPNGRVLRLQPTSSP